ncbi:hypothetical protein RclHR1_15760005 [Rhizophagus clarus]|uniref:DUF659 domain-containing protein n=1 Tax=Rhizophagus clarus TaxID=94130 RepID=A0A2Z6QTI6_9GLOM|nr:hypothetical protein RclHR1_15760005 [Rhizophagus clarus]
MLTKRTTPYTRQKEFPGTFNVLNNTLVCLFCGHSVSWEHKVSVTTHTYNVLSVAESKKTVVNDLVKAFVEANIPLEKVNMLQPFLRKHCREEDLKDFFREKTVSIIVDETTDSRARSVVNILFSYRNNTRLVAVDYLDNVNNVTIGQLIIRTLIEWSIPFSFPRLLASDSAAYMKKSYRELLKPIMPQLLHSPCLAHILNLISLAWTSIPHFDLVKTLLANIKKTFVLTKARRARYLLFLSRNGVQNPASVPLSVATRWNSWFGMAFYVNDYYQYLRISIWKGKKMILMK